VRLSLWSTSVRIEHGLFKGQPFTAASVIDPLADSVRGYRPIENPGRRSSARTGLALSYNFHAIAALEAAGEVRTADFLERVTGSRPTAGSMMAIGGAAGSELSLLNLVRAYTLFASNGRLANTTFEHSVTQDGLAYPLTESPARNVADEGAAYVVTRMMRSVVGPRGTASSFLQLAGFGVDSEVAAKSGTGMVADLWFIVVMPNLIVGGWVGMPQNEVPMLLKDGFSGSLVVAPMVAKYLREVRQIRPELLTGEFKQPSGVTKMRIRPESNCVTTTGGFEEYFMLGREPGPCR
jgi:membrane peptidoglycan carboxypeptidase